MSREKDQPRQPASAARDSAATLTPCRRIRHDDAPEAPLVARILRVQTRTADAQGPRGTGEFLSLRRVLPVEWARVLHPLLLLAAPALRLAVPSRAVPVERVWRRAWPRRSRGGAGRATTDCSSSSAAADPHPSERRAPPDALPRHQRPRRRSRRGRPPRPRLRAGLRDEPRVLRLLHASGSPLTSRISRFRASAADPNLADDASAGEDPARRRPALRQPQRRHGGLRPRRHALHGLRGRGRRRRPGDPEDHAQNPSTLLGKMIRIDVDFSSFTDDYSIPSDNPFVGNNGLQARDLGARPAQPVPLQLRPPDRRPLHRRRRRRASLEEIDVEPAGSPGGRNYGWDVMEGTSCFDARPGRARRATTPSLTLPVYEYTHSQGCAVTGGNVYRGSLPGLQGQYLFADYASARIWSLVWDGGGGIVGGVVDRTDEFTPRPGQHRERRWPSARTAPASSTSSTSGRRGLPRRARQRARLRQRPARRRRAVRRRQPDERRRLRQQLQDHRLRRRHRHAPASSATTATRPRATAATPTARRTACGNGVVTRRRGVRRRQPDERRRLRQPTARTTDCGDGIRDRRARQCDDGNLDERRRLRRRLHRRPRAATAIPRRRRAVRRRQPDRRATAATPTARPTACGDGIRDRRRAVRRRQPSSRRRLRQPTAQSIGLRRRASAPASEQCDDGNLRLGRRLRRRLHDDRLRRRDPRPPARSATTAT